MIHCCRLYILLLHNKLADYRIYNGSYFFTSMENIVSFFFEYLLLIGICFYSICSLANLCNSLYIFYTHKNINLFSRSGFVYSVHFKSENLCVHFKSEKLCIYGPLFIHASWIIIPSLFVPKDSYCMLSYLLNLFYT